MVIMPHLSLIEGSRKLLQRGVFQVSGSSACFQIKFAAQTCVFLLQKNFYHVHNRDVIKQSPEQAQ